jgi:hypothetical protein
VKLGQQVTLEAPFVALAAFLLFGFQVADAQATWLNDDQAREVAGAAIHSVYPEPCYSTYRNERLESFVLSVRSDRILDHHLNDSVYFYRVASDACDYVVEKDGKTVLMSQVSMVKLARATGSQETGKPMRCSSSSRGMKDYTRIQPNPSCSPRCTASLSGATPATMKFGAWDSSEIWFSGISGRLILPTSATTSGSENLSAGGGTFDHACHN